MSIAQGCGNRSRFSCHGYVKFQDLLDSSFLHEFLLNPRVYVFLNLWFLVYHIGVAKIPVRQTTESVNILDKEQVQSFGKSFYKLNLNEMTCQIKIHFEV